MPKVFIIEPPRNNIDVSKATEYGDIVYVFEHDDRRCSIFQCTEFGKTILDNLEVLKYDPDEDYICVVGALLTVTISLIAITQMYETFSLLLFDSVHNEYIKRRFHKMDWKGFENGVKDTSAV